MDISETSTDFKFNKRILRDLTIPDTTFFQNKLRRLAEKIDETQSLITSNRVMMEMSGFHEKQASATTLRSQLMQMEDKYKVSQKSKNTQDARFGSSTEITMAFRSAMRNTNQGSFRTRTETSITSFPRTTSPSRSSKPQSITENVNQNERFKKQLRRESCDNNKQENTGCSVLKQQERRKKWHKILNKMSDASSENITFIVD